MQKKIHENSTAQRASKTKKQIFGVVFSILSVIISIVGIAILCWGLVYLLDWIFNSLQSPPQYIYGAEFLQRISMSITAHDWMFILVPIALVLLIVNIYIFVRKRKKSALSIASLCLSIVFFVTGAISWCSALYVIFTVDELRQPSVCLSYVYDEDNVQSIMEDLERYGFVEQDGDDEFLTILDTNGTAKVSFPISLPDSVSKAYQFYLNNNNDLAGTVGNYWYAVVNDGSITDIYMKTHTDIYMYVEKGVMTENPCSNYLFSQFILSDYSIHCIIDLVEEKIIGKYDVSEEEVEFLWESAIRDRENSTLDVWQACIHGCFWINERKYTVYITLTAKSDDEIYTVMENQQTGVWPFSVIYYIDE